MRKNSRRSHRRWEGPGAGTRLGLGTARPWRLRATLRSRCQRIEIARPPPAVACEWLSREMGTPPLEGLLEISDGAPLRAPVRQNAAMLERNPYWGYSNAAGGFRAAQYFPGAVGRDHHLVRRLREGTRLELLRHFDAIHARHLPVEEDDVVRLAHCFRAIDRGNRRLAAVGLIRLHAHRVEQVHEHRARMLVIVDDQRALARQVGVEDRLAAPRGAALPHAVCPPLAGDQVRSADG